MAFRADIKGQLIVNAGNAYVTSNITPTTGSAILLCGGSLTLHRNNYAISTDASAIVATGGSLIINTSNAMNASEFIGNPYALDVSDAVTTLTVTTGWFYGTMKSFNTNKTEWLKPTTSGSYYNDDAKSLGYLKSNCVQCSGSYTSSHGYSYTYKGYED